MANVLSGNCFTIDTIGYISTEPIKVKKIVFYPNTEADVATFTCADFGSANTLDTETDEIVVVSSNTLHHDGLFAAAKVGTIGSGVEITHSNTGASLGKFFMTVRSSDDQTYPEWAVNADRRHGRYT